MGGLRIPSGRVAFRDRTLRAILNQDRMIALTPAGWTSTLGIQRIAIPPPRVVRGSRKGAVGRVEMKTGLIGRGAALRWGAAAAAGKGDHLTVGRGWSARWPRVALEVIASVRRGSGFRSWVTARAAQNGGGRRVSSSRAEGRASEAEYSVAAHLPRPPQCTHVNPQRGPLARFT